jgi:hypothetical protein
VAYRIIFRQDLSQNWQANNPLLLSGEMGYETDTNQLKLGNGVDVWNSLEYFKPGPTGPTGSFVWSEVPGSTGSTGVAGSMAYGQEGGTGYLYVAYDTNLWGRVSLLSFS